VRYALDAARQTYSFALGDYDRSRPLVIDPLLKSVSAGTGEDFANAVVASTHRLRLRGWTPVPPMTFLPWRGFDAFNGGTSAFVSRLVPI
jgi:hypothetical protein